MSESKEPEGTPAAQGSTQQQDLIPDAAPGAAGAAPAASGAAPAAPGAAGAAPAASGAAPAVQQALTAAMQPVVEAMQGAIRAEQEALAAVQPAVAAMAAELTAGGAPGAAAAATVQQAMQQTLQPVVAAMEGALAAEQQALTAMRPAATMQQALGAMPQVVTAMTDVVAAETKALDVMRLAVAGQPAARDIQGSLAVADGAARDLTLRDTDGVLRDQPSGDGAFFGQLKGVPIDYLIATPLISSARANLALASVMAEFINEIGFLKDGKTRKITFTLTRPVQNMTADPPKYDKYEVEVEAPLLALVPLPALLIDTVNIDLTVEISNKTQQKATDERKAELKVGAGWGAFSASFTGSYSLKQENTRDTNQTAKYEVRVVARQQPLPEGMSKLMDVFASTIVPLEKLDTKAA